MRSTSLPPTLPPLPPRLLPPDLLPSLRTLHTARDALLGRLVAAGLVGRRWEVASAPAACGRQLQLARDMWPC